MKYLEAKRLADEGQNKALGGPASNKSTAAEAEGPTATPQAKQLARELSVDLKTLTGTGAGGAVTAGDVRKAADERSRGHGE